jgi:hypothetical protein
MSSLAYKTERVLNILRELPPAKVNEVIDFAEYLKQKSLKTKQQKQTATELSRHTMDEWLNCPPVCASGRSPEEMDRYIQELRSSWE